MTQTFYVRYRKSGHNLLDLYRCAQKYLRIFLLEHHAGDAGILERVVDTEYGGTGAGHLRAIRAIGNHHGADIVDVEMLLQHKRRNSAGIDDFVRLDEQLGAVWLFTAIRDEKRNSDRKSVGVAAVPALVDGGF